MTDLIIPTQRLELIAATVATLDQELNGIDRLSEALNATVPASWPPEGNDEEVVRYFRKHLSKGQDQVGWWSWYIILTAGERTVIGTCGCKGHPNANGEVEIGYALVPEYHGRGYAAEAVQGFVDCLWHQPRVQLVFAEVLTDNEPSKRLLLRLGFHENGVGVEPGTSRFEIHRPDTSSQ